MTVYLWVAIMLPIDDRLVGNALAIPVETMYEFSFGLICSEAVCVGFS